MPFYNREKDIRQMKAILSGEPNLVYFVYGPINSGKTALITKVFEELPENYRTFYINFRGRYVQTVEDLIKVLFRVKRGKVSEEIKEFVREFLQGGTKLLQKMKGIPIPENIFDILFKRTDKIEDIFAFLEEYFEEVRDEGYEAIFVLDEMQTIKELINTAGRPVIHELFNFLVRLTKETHLCHCLCATSDCLFIEDVYSNARLEGRAKYILVDDLQKEEAFKLYDEFGFENREFVWEYIGGKVGDMVTLFEEKKRGLSEKDAIKEILKDSSGRISDFLEKIEYGEKFFEYEGKKVRIEKDKIVEIFRIFKNRETIRKEEIIPSYRNYLVSENILFYNPVDGIIRPQSRLLWQAIKKLV